MNAGVTRWWLLRHAPMPAPAGMIAGQLDLDADCSDGAAFAALARILPADALWLISPLRRTRQTADAILVDLSLVPVVEPDLAEQHFGSWQGRSYDDIQATEPDRAARFWQAPAVERPPGGESFADLVARVAAVLAARSRDHAGRDIVAVCHGGTIRAALALALGLAPDRALAFRIDPLSLTRLDHIPVPGAAPVWRVEAVNLPPGAVPP
jgi:alpha-ribazole phosphatase